jgi:hypothetical protein
MDSRKGLVKGTGLGCEWEGLYCIRYEQSQVGIEVVISGAIETFAFAVSDTSKVQGKGMWFVEVESEVVESDFVWWALFVIEVIAKYIHGVELELLPTLPSSLACLLARC